MNQRNIYQQLFEPLLRYWPVLVFAVGVIIAFANQQNTNAQNEQTHNNLDTRTTAIEASQTQIMVQLSQIQADLGWIKTKFK